MSAGPSRLRPMTDVSAADWVVDGVGSFGSGVNGLVPSDFESYARILHPAWRGELPPNLLSALCEFLASHTATPDRCWFCLWVGWGWIDGGPSAAIMSTSQDVDDPFVDIPPAFGPEIMNGPRVSLPGRDYILFAGPLAAATEMGWRVGELVNQIRPDAGIAPDEFDPQTPSLFWPDDHAWCVATEVDLDSTYLGGSEAMVRALLADPRFEAWRAELDDVVHGGGDDVDR